MKACGYVSNGNATVLRHAFIVLIVAACLPGAAEGANLQELCNQLRSEDNASLRQAAASELGKTGDSQALSCLEGAICDSSPIVTSEAIRALGTLGKTEAGATLINILTGQPRPVANCQQSQPQPTEAPDPYSETERAWAANSLGMLNSPSAVESLSGQLLDPSHKVVFECVLALSRLKAVTALPALQSIASHPDEKVRRAVAMTVAGLEKLPSP